jgi:hypothetical protein
MIESVAVQPWAAAFTPTLPAVVAQSPGEDSPVFAEAMLLSQRETADVLTRATSARLCYRLADGRLRTRRAAYVYMDGNMYVPSASWAAIFEHGVARRLDCDVNELAGLSYWRYVRASGVASLLQPTGDTEERAEWRRGMSALDEGMLLSDSVQSLTYGNFGLIRIVVDQTVGALMVLE